jgi:hypothetical protein
MADDAPGGPPPGGGHLDDRDGAPGVRGLVAVGGIRREDLIRELPAPGSLRLVIDDLGVESLAAKLDLGMDAKVVEPSGVVRQIQLRGDERYPLPVVEVNDTSTSRLPGPCAASLEQRRRGAASPYPSSSTELRQEKDRASKRPFSRASPARASRRAGVYAR